MLTGRRIALALALLLLGVQVVRNAAAAASVSSGSAAPANLWPGHPDVARIAAMTQIAAAARASGTVPQSVFAKLDRVASQAPLAPEPFLVEGVQAQLQGRAAVAFKAFRAAEMRDIRSLPAHYFLADAALRSGDLRTGLRQFGILARLAPNGTGAVAPAVAAFAADERNWPALRALFRSDPKLEDQTLVALAQDPANAGSVLALAAPARRSLASPWAEPLIAGLIKRGDYSRARAIWAELSGIALTPDLLLNDPQFRRSGAAAPFDWQLTSSPLGLAEARPGGKLHLLYYGDDSGVLARQLLVLPPGRYRLTHRVLGGAANAAALAWTVDCAAGGGALASATVPRAASHGFAFQIPAGCPAAWLQLVGTGMDIPRQTDATVLALRLTRDGASE